MPAYEFRNADSPPGGWRLARRQWKFSVDGGEESTITMFTVTGTVFVQVFGVCQVAPVAASGHPTMELGIAGNTAALIAQMESDQILQYMTWQDATPEANPGAVNLTGRSFVITNGADIILTLATAHVNTGTIDFYCLWAPLSSDGAITAA